MNIAIIYIPIFKIIKINLLNSLLIFQIFPERLLEGIYFDCTVLLFINL